MKKIGALTFSSKGVVIVFPSINNKTILPKINGVRAAGAVGMVNDL